MRSIECKNADTDPGIALGLFMSDPRDAYGYAESYTDAVVQAATRTNKPLAVVSNYSMVDDRKLAEKVRQAGVPLLQGTSNALKAASHMMTYRDVLKRVEVDERKLQDPKGWLAMLSDKGRLTEVEGLRMLADFGIRSPVLRKVEDASCVIAALDGLRFPIVLKTGENHAHKSDVGGVVLNLGDAVEAASAYADMSARLGPKAMFMEMAPKGVELALGSIWDDSFGPVVLISAGGVLIEFLNDSIAALAAFDEVEAKRLLQELRIYRLLLGVRGAPPADLDDAARQIAAFSRMVAALGPTCRESDINPLICTPQGAFALDCLVVGSDA